MTVPYSPEVPVEDLPDTAVAALVEAEGSAQDAVAERLLLILAALWAGFTAYWDGVAVVDFATRVATIVQAAQRRAGGLTEQHLRRQYQRLGIDLPTVPLVDLPPDLRVGADTVQVYQRPVRMLRHLIAQEERAEAEAAVLALQRLQAQATTDLQLARATAAQQVLYQAPEVTTGWRRIIHPELGSVCGLCIAASDRVYRRIERMDLHPGCVTGDTLISAAGVSAATRRWHTGSLVVLRTASGQEVRLTRNHPVLTDQGWVAADRLQKGGRVVRDAFGQRNGRSVPDEQQKPASAEDVWRALTVTGSLLPSSVPLAPEDLHGDGGNGEVDVVLVDSHLAPVGDVTFVQPCSELGFGSTHSRRAGFSAARSFDLLGMGLDTTARSLVGGSRDFVSVAGTTLIAQKGGLGPGSDRYFSAPESTDDGGAGYVEVGRQLQDRLTGQVEFDDLVEVDVIAWSGHVYNFQTLEGWYDASSIVVSNCKCTTAPIVRVDGQVRDPGRALNAADLSAIYAAAGNTTESRALSRTRIQVRENGELGRILMADGVEYKGPKKAQNQLSPAAAEQRLLSIQRQLAQLRSIDAPNQWYRDRIEQLEELAAAA